jgi:hypothetical protein
MMEEKVEVKDDSINAEVPTGETKEPVNADAPPVPTFSTVTNVGFASDRNAQHRRVMEVSAVSTVLILFKT